MALLPNGENAHITIKEPKWWYDKIIEIIKIKKNLKIICNCTIYKDRKLQPFPLQFNDKINNVENKKEIDKKLIDIYESKEKIKLLVQTYKEEENK